VVDVECPALGIRVVLTRALWLNKIVRQHPEIGMLGPPSIAEAIRFPEKITDNGLPGANGIDGPRLAFYATAPRPYSALKLRVIANRGSRKAYIVTCHLISSVPEREVVRWERP
jgi:hypothetical protein